MALTISTSPRQFFIDANGKPAAGGTLRIFEANTTTPALTWFDRDGLVTSQNSDPIPLDALGSCVVWMEAGKVYDFLAKDILGNTIDNTKGISGATSTTVAPSQWNSTGLTPTFINTRTFSLVGNQTANYHVGRRVRTTNTGGTKYATIIASAFSSVTTVTLGFQNTTDVLDSGLSAVDIATETYTNPAIHQGIGSIVDLTGYTGADVALGIGQSATYALSSVSSVLLRIATTNEQCYEIDLQTNYVAGAVIVATATLQPNNTNTAANAVKNHTVYSNNTANQPPLFSTNNLFVVSAGNTLMSLLIRVCTRTLSKKLTSDFVTQDNALWYQGRIESEWLDTTTGWTSLGTLNFQSTLSARLTVKRLW